MTLSNDTDEEGPPPAAHEVWRANVDDVVRYATALVGPHDAPDVTTNAFLRLTAGGQPISKVARRHWFRLVGQEASNHHRQHRRRRRRDLLATLGIEAPPVEYAVDLHRQIVQLSLKQRAAVFLAYWEDMTEAEIAEHLAVSTGTVHRLLSRARANLRKALQ